jgi:predicted amidohydrolase
MESNELKIVLLQQDLVWENVIENLAHFGNLIYGLNQEVDIVMLPEMFTTGFSMQPEIFAMYNQEHSLKTIKKWASDKGVAICGSIMVAEDSRYFNRFFWIEPNSDFSFYDKAHLFRMGEENLHYSKGNTHQLINYKGWKIAPFVCYDLRFPVWMRKTKTYNYDLIILVANWPERRASHWKALTLARAIENQCYLAAVNRIGSDKNNINHSGDSCVINPLGEFVFEAKNSKDLNIITIDKVVVDNCRQQFPAEEDADSFEIL